MYNQKTPTSYTDHGDSYYIPAEVIIRESRNPFLSNLILTKIGCFENAKGHGITRIAIDEYIVIYCIDGKGTAFSGGLLRNVYPGDIVLLQKNCPHAYYSDDLEPWTILWAHFDGAAVDSFSNLLGVTETDFIKPIGIIPEAISLLRDSYKTLQTGYSLPNLFHATTLLQEFFSYVIKTRFNSELSVNSTLENVSASEIKNILDFMSRHIYDNLNLEQFASYAGLSKYHFSRLFNNKTGYSPMEYYNRLKIQRACELLDTSSLSIKQISITLSYNNPYYFSEAFKRIIGCSPKSYRLQSVFVTRNIP